MTSSPVPRRRWVRPALVTLSVLLALLAAGCMTVTYDLRVEDDGSGELTVELLLSRELQDQLDASGEAFSAAELGDVSSQAVPPDLRDKVSIEGVERDGRSGFSIRFRYQDLEELSELQTASGTATGGEDPVQELRVRQVGNSWRFEAQVGSPQASGADAQAQAELGEAFSQMLGDLGEFEVRYSVTLPGAIVDSNADEVDGATARWTFTLDEAAPDRIWARSGPAEGLPTTWVAAGIALLLVLLVCGLVLLRRSRTTRAPTIVAGADTTATMPTLGGAAPGWGQPSPWGPPGGAPPGPPYAPPGAPPSAPPPGPAAPGGAPPPWAPHPGPPTGPPGAPPTAPPPAPSAAPPPGPPPAPPATGAPSPWAPPPTQPTEQVPQTLPPTTPPPTPPPPPPPPPAPPAPPPA